MTVTDIKDYKVKGKYEIYLNDEFAFLLYKSELKKYNINIGDEISTQLYNDVLNDTLLKRSKKRAMNILLKGDVPERKLREKLSENLYPEKCIEDTISYVKKYNYVDDSRFARTYIGLNANSKSRQVIKNKLVEKGIDKDTIEEQLRIYYDEDELNFGTEEELLKKLFLKKIKGRDISDYNEKQKVYASLFRKGFTIGQIEKVYNEYLENI